MASRCVLILFLVNQQWNKNWISHDFFASGQTMEITLGESPSSWGTGDDDLPPSLSTGGFAFDQNGLERVGFE